MAKYHINAQGQPGLCRATRSCPFGGEADHYASVQEARAGFEASMSEAMVPQAQRSGVPGARNSALGARDHVATIGREELDTIARAIIARGEEAGLDYRYTDAEDIYLQAWDRMPAEAALMGLTQSQKDDLKPEAEDTVEELERKNAYAFKLVQGGDTETATQAIDAALVIQAELNRRRGNSNGVAYNGGRNLTTPGQAYTQPASYPAYRALTEAPSPSAGDIFDKLRERRIA